MKNDKIHDLYEKIIPDQTLIDQTKQLIQERAVGQKRKARFTPQWSYALAIIVVALGILGGLQYRNAITPKVYPATLQHINDFTVADTSSIITVFTEGDESLRLPDVEQPATDGMHSFNQQYFAYAKASKNTKRLVVDGKITKIQTYQAKDSQQYGILGLHQMEVQITSVDTGLSTTSKYKKGDTITVFYPISNAATFQSPLKNGDVCVMYLLAGEKDKLSDPIGKALEIRNGFLVYYATTNKGE